MPRRIPDYPDAFAEWNAISSFGSILSVIATILFIRIAYLMFTGQEFNKGSTANIGGNKITWIDYYGSKLIKLDLLRKTWVSNKLSVKQPFSNVVSYSLINTVPSTKGGAADTLREELVNDNIVHYSIEQAIPDPIPSHPYNMLPVLIKISNSSYDSKNH